MEKQDKRSARIDPSIQVPPSINLLLPKTLFCMYAHTPHRNLENELGLKLFFMLKFMQIKESASSAFFLSKFGVLSYVPFVTIAAVLHVLLFVCLTHLP